jgi:hypothetical protein
MPLTFSQYIERRRHVHLTIHDSFLSKYPQFKTDNVLINDCTNDSVVVSIIEGDEITVFCFAVQNSGTTKFEITSETQMKYFTENLSSRLPSLIWLLNNQMMFDEDAQADHFRKIGNRIDIIELTNKHFGKLFMVMFDSTIYFFRIDFENDVFCFKLPLCELNQTTYRDTDQGIPNLGRCLDSFRFFTNLKVYDNNVRFDIFSNVFNQGNYCVGVSCMISFDDDTLEKNVECSRTLISMGQYDDNPFTSGSEPEREKTDFSDKTLMIRDENFEEEDSDEEKEDPMLVVETTDGNRIYVFEMRDDIDFYCIIFRNGIVYLLQVDRYVLSRLKSSNSEELIAVFELDLVDFSKRFEGFGEVVGSCRIVMADPIKITCYFQNSVGRIVLTKQLIIENDELRET